jgi:hypothetical protein
MGRKPLGLLETGWNSTIPKAVGIDPINPHQPMQSRNDVALTTCNISRILAASLSGRDIGCIDFVFPLP